MFVKSFILLGISLPIAIAYNETYDMNRNDYFTVICGYIFSKGKNLEQQGNVKFAQYCK